MKKIIISNYKDKNLLVKNGLFSVYLSNNNEVLSGVSLVLYCHDTSTGAMSWHWELWMDSGGWVKVDESDVRNASMFPPDLGTFYIKLSINGGASTVQSEPFLIEHAPTPVVADFTISADDQTTWPPDTMFWLGFDPRYLTDTSTGSPSSWLWEIDNNGGNIFLSTNNGTCWNAIGTGLTDSNINALIAKGSNIFAGTWAGIFLSADNGASWTAVNSGITGMGLYVQSFAVSGDNLYAGTLGGVFLSTNDGVSWIPVNTGLTNPHIICLLVDGGNIFAGTREGGIFLSTDGGLSWAPINTGLTDPRVYALAVNGINLFAGTVGGVFLSINNGSTWAPANVGLPIDPYIGSFVVSGGDIFTGTGGYGVFISTNNGASWAPVNTGLPPSSSVRSLAVKGGNLLAGTYVDGIFLSTNNGASWTSVSSSFACVSLLVKSSDIFAGTIGRRPYIAPHTFTTQNVDLLGLYTFDPNYTYTVKLAINGGASVLVSDPFNTGFEED